MAISFELNAEPRTDTGKGASRRLRLAGKVPAIIYGGDKDPEALTLSHNEVQRNLEHEAFYSHILTINTGGTKTSAILRDLQRHPSKPVVMHVDLQRVSADEELRTHVPVHFIGKVYDLPWMFGGVVVDKHKVNVRRTAEHWFRVQKRAAQIDREQAAFGRLAPFDGVLGYSVQCLGCYSHVGWRPGGWTRGLKRRDPDFRASNFTVWTGHRRPCSPERQT